jgi:hypothetical protein
MPTSIMSLAASGLCPLARHLVLPSPTFSTALTGATKETNCRRALPSFSLKTQSHFPGGKLRLVKRPGSSGRAVYGTALVPAPCRAGGLKLQTLSACAYVCPNSLQQVGKKFAHATAGQIQRSQGGRSGVRKLEKQGGSTGKGPGAVQVKSAATRAELTADVITGPMFDCNSSFNTLESLTGVA